MGPWARRWQTPDLKHTGVPSGWKGWFTSERGGQGPPTVLVTWYCVGWGQTIIPEESGDGTGEGERGQDPEFCLRFLEDARH